MLPRMTRVALYSHDSQGLGHVRRSLALASGLRAGDPTTQTLVLTGADEAAALPRPQGCDVVGVPALTKSASGRYGARHLDLSLAELVRLRGAVLTAALTSFAPDVVVVDRHPRGFAGELEEALGALPPDTRVVLGLRDVLDEPRVARAEWADQQGTAALDEWYDEVWVYGDPRVFDCVDALRLPPSWRERVRYSGYLAPHAPQPPATFEQRPAGGEVVCLVGGGGDGRPLAEAFALASWPAGDGLLVLGPQMAESDRDEVRRAAAGRADLEVVDFVPDLMPRVAGAHAAVTMGGYNTVCEMLAYRIPTLVVPRVRPRLEQLVRADRLAELGLLDVLHPDVVTPDRLTSWLHGVAGRSRGTGTPDIDIDGIATVPRLLRSLAGHRTFAPEVVDVAV
jgi:predicted glycosyltransferase